MTPEEFQAIRKLVDKLPDGPAEAHWGTEALSGYHFPSEYGGDDSHEEATAEALSKVKPALTALLAEVDRLNGRTILGDGLYANPRSAAQVHEMRELLKHFYEKAILYSRGDYETCGCPGRNPTGYGPGQYGYEHDDKCENARAKELVGE